MSDSKYEGRYAAESTQEQYPWRATVRTIFAAVISFAAMWPLIVEALGLHEGWAWVGASIAVTGAITRVMAVPAVNEWLNRFIPWLAAKPATD